jgi:caspase domain-containing protein
MRSLGVLAAVLVAVPGISHAETRFLFVIGHNRGTSDEAPLRWAESDAKRYMELVREIGNVAPQRTRLLLSPSSAELREAWSEMKGMLIEAKERGDRTVLLYYFSGHGDASSIHLGGERQSRESLRRELLAAPASTVFAVVDACRTDRGLHEKGAVRAPGFAWPLEPGAPEGFVMLTSAAAGEVAQESDELGGSLFTHHLLSGMRGSADADGDGTVTLAELYAYGYSRTLEETHRQTTAVQHSELEVALSGRGALTLTYPRRAIATLELGEDIVGRVLVIDDASGRVVAEVTREGRQAIQLAVPPGRYRVHLRRDDAVLSGLVAIKDGKRALRARDLTVQPTLAAAEKGARLDPYPYLFSVGGSLGRSLVDGFAQVPSARFGLAYRSSEALRAGVEVEAGYVSGANDAWTYRQGEMTALAGVDLVQPLDGFAVTAGLRAGVAGVLQRGDRQDASRLESDQFTTPLRNTVFALGPKLALALGVEAEVFDQIGLRVAGEPFIAWLPTEERGMSGGASGLRIGIAIAVATMFRL